MVMTNADARGEGDEDFSISIDGISGPGTASSPNSLTLTITDDAAGKLPRSLLLQNHDVFFWGVGRSNLTGDVHVHVR